MKVTGQQYLNLNPGLKAANVDPLQHFLQHVCPEGPLREPRVIDVPDAPTLPVDWDWEQYLAANRDLRAASYDTKEEAESHYLNHGHYEHRPLRLVIPLDWEDAAYLFKYPDVAADGYYFRFPLAHFRDTEATENRLWKPEGWSTAQYRENYPTEDFGANPLLHWWKDGEREGRSYKKPAPPEPPTLPVYPLGLSLVFESSDPKECFCALETSAGLQIGRYGLNKGGADILLNGKVEQVFPDRESVYDLHMPPDGQPLLITEHYASVFKKIGGTWQQRYARAQHDLMLAIKPAADGSIWALWRQWEGTTSGLVRSFDQGMNWQEVRTFPGFVLNGLCIDGNEVSMVGRNGTGEVLIDVNGNILTTTPNWYLEYTNWSVCKASGVWSIGTWNSRDKPQENGDGIEGFINWFDGTITHTGWGGHQWPFMQDMIIHLGKRWCIGTYGWDDASGRPSILLQSPVNDGKNWWKACDIPCSHVMGLNPGKEGVYISGGKKDSFGWVGHFRPY